MQFMLLFSRQGKLRLQKWYVPLSDKEKKKITRELVQTVLARKPKMCSFLEWRDLKIVYKRYASLYFCCAIENQDNELITLEIIHRYVELLDKYFGSVCELDIIFNFEKAYFILDEFLLGGEAQETSKKNVLKAIEQADLLQELQHDYFNQPVCCVATTPACPECRVLAPCPRLHLAQCRPAEQPHLLVLGLDPFTELQRTCHTCISHHRLPTQSSFSVCVTLDVRETLTYYWLSFYIILKVQVIS
ncbi:AP-1 complex subunit sigma-2 isoform X1 [Conger conger]|uniref:AP-1 complex subunit sigma-2 isoform X1 n=1 Tax=Conger conger TaxID=82655 RepID=UPI002A5A2B94|nr:AP-1 complex subunit sigma-2 isoform X1 [Conger conger]